MKEVNGFRQYILWNGDDEYEIMDTMGNAIERVNRRGYEKGFNVFNRRFKNFPFYIL